MGQNFCAFCLLTFSGSFAGTRAEFCQDGNFTKFYAKSLCILTIDIFPIMQYNKDTKEREVIEMADLIKRELRCEYCGGLIDEGDHTTEEDKTGLIRDCMGYCVDCGTRYNWRENYALVSIEPYYVGERGGE